MCKGKCKRKSGDVCREKYLMDRLNKTEALLVRALSVMDDSSDAACERQATFISSELEEITNV